MTQTPAPVYHFDKLDVFQQFHIARRLAPTLAKLAGSVQGLSSLKDSAEDAQQAGMAALPQIAQALQEMPQDDADYVLFGLLRCVKRQEPNGMGYAPLIGSDGRSLMFSDVTLPDMLGLAVSAFRANLGDFSSAIPSAFQGGSRKPSAA